VVKARSQRDIVAGVPFQCGFHPQQSVVVISLRGPRQRVGLVTRVDLPDRADVEAAVDQMVELVTRDEGSATVVLVYDDLDWDAALPPHDRLVRALLDRLETQGIAALDALYVSRDRFWSYLCRNPRCCPPQGQPVADGQSSPVAAAYVMAGLAPLADRAALAARVEPDRPLLVAAVMDSAWRWLGAFAAELDAEGGDPSGVEQVGRHREAQAAARFERVLATYRAGAESLSVDDAAELIASLQSIPVRDAMVLRFCRSGLPAGTATWLDRDLHTGAAGVLDRMDRPGLDPHEEEDAVERLLVSLCARAYGPLAAAPLSLLGWHSWARGEGALARVAVERALTEDPTYRLAKLLLAMLDHAIAPEWVAEMRRDDEQAS
jgi:hypothetical protein